MMMGRRTGHLRDLNRVCQPVAEMIAESRRENLGLTLQPPERARVNDAIAVALKIGAVWVSRLGKYAAAQALGTQS